MRLAAPVVLILSLVAGIAVASDAGLFSKRYQFRSGVILEVGATGPEGIRLDTVHFELPARVDGRALRTSGLATADVAVSNTGGASRKVGVAIALYDADGRLLGVASGGTKLASIRPDRQKTFGLVFDGVNAAIHEATAFQISLESKP